MKLSKQQQRTLRDLYTQTKTDCSYTQFRRTVKFGFHEILIQRNGSWLGIDESGGVS